MLDLVQCMRRSPFFIDTSSPQEDLIDPAVKGTQNVLRAAAAAKGTLKRVILTSSVAGMPLLLPDVVAICLPAPSVRSVISACMLTCVVRACSRAW